MSAIAVRRPPVKEPAAEGGDDDLLEVVVSFVFSTVGATSERVDELPGDIVPVVIVFVVGFTVVPGAGLLPAPVD
jgi:hypothetical protein